MSPGSYILKPILSFSHCLLPSPLLEHGFLTLGTKPTGDFRGSIHLMKLYAKLCACANVHFSRAVDLWLTSHPERRFSEEVNSWMNEWMKELWRLCSSICKKRKEERRKRKKTHKHTKNWTHSSHQSITFQDTVAKLKQSLTLEE